jgi:hypothetical protein
VYSRNFFQAVIFTMNHSLAGKNGPQPTGPFWTDRKKIAESKAFRVAIGIENESDFATTLQPDYLRAL